MTGSYSPTHVRGLDASCANLYTKDHNSIYFERDQCDRTQPWEGKKMLGKRGTMSLRTDRT